MDARHARRLAPPAALCLLALSACGGGGGDGSATVQEPVSAAALGPLDPTRDIRRAIVIEVSEETFGGEPAREIGAVSVAFDAPIDAAALLRSADGPLSVLEVAGAEGCLFVDRLDDFERLGTTLLDGVENEDGATVLLSTPTGSFGELTLEPGGHDDNVAWLPDGDLPRGSRVAVVGGGTPDFDGVPLPHLAAPSRFSLAGYDPSTYNENDALGTVPRLRADSELSWESGADDGQIVLVTAIDANHEAGPDAEGNVPFKAVFCTAEDVGRFVFPQTARTWMGDGFESLAQWNVQRAGWTVAREGDTAVLLTRTQLLDYDTLLFR